jgi:hypothetical protein
MRPAVDLPVALLPNFRVADFQARASGEASPAEVGSRAWVEKLPSHDFAFSVPAKAR